MEASRKVENVSVTGEGKEGGPRQAAVVVEAEDW